MTINLNPSELQLLIEQITAALLPTFEKRVSTASKATAEALQCLTVEDVAKRLKCDKKTVCKYINEGKLRAANLGTCERPTWKVSEADLLSFYSAHRIGK